MGTGCGVSAVLAAERSRDAVGVDINPSAVEAGITDEGHRALTRLVAGAREHLAPGGRVLVFFGSSGDLDHLARLPGSSGFAGEVLAGDDLVTSTDTVSHHAFRLTPG